MSDDPKKEEGDEPGVKKRGLGRGLNALFEDEEGEYPQADGTQEGGDNKRVVLGLDVLQPGKYQPRGIFSKDSIKELADSIAEHGVLQPLIVRPKNGSEGIYEIIAGERRWRAAQEAQLHEVPVVIQDFGDQQALEIALIENLQREDLNPLEEARGYVRLMDEFGHTQEKAAKSLGKSRSHVANMVRLLNLPSSVLAMIEDGRLSAGHARTLLTADDPERVANMIVNQGLSVRDAEALHGRAKGKKSRAAAKSKDVDTLALEDELSNTLGMRVSIDVKGKGAGTLKVDFKSLDQLDDVLHRLSHFPGRQQSG